MNVSATLNVFKLLLWPQMAKPHVTYENFLQMPIPLNSRIKAVVLDKDNCISRDQDDKVYHEYVEHLEALKTYYTPEALLIVSNSAGTADDIDRVQANRIEENCGIHVLDHQTKKPGCHQQILDHFISKGIVSDATEVAIVGDRLFTDVLMANMMGSYGVWLSEGVERSEKVIVRMEGRLSGYL